MNETKSAITQAIRQGAPIYNSGQPKACYELYKVTAQQIIERGISSPCVKEALREAILLSSGQASPSDAAWVMRKCFDNVMDGSVEAMATPSPVLAEGATDFPVLDFGNGLPPAPRWFSMDDGVMGGMSSSQFSWDATDKAAVFQGNVTTRNNGGFASMRSESWGGYGAFQKARGLRMEVCGDGRIYKLSAKPDDGFDGVMYQHDFATTADGRWQTVDLHFSYFKPNFRGRMVAGRPPLVGSQIRQLGLMVSKFSDTGGLTAGFREGPFRLALRSFRGFV